MHFTQSYPALAINLMSEEQIRSAIAEGSKRDEALRKRLAIVTKPVHTTEVRVVGFKGKEIVSEIAGELNDRHLADLCEDPKRFLAMNRPAQPGERISVGIKSLERVFGVIQGGVKRGELNVFASGPNPPEAA